MWCIAEIDQQYRERMYDVLDLYEKPYNAQEPVICVAHKSKQLIEEKHKPISSPIKKVD